MKNLLFSLIYYICKFPTFIRAELFLNKVKSSENRSFFNSSSSLHKDGFDVIDTFLPDYLVQQILSVSSFNYDQHVNSVDIPSHLQNELHALVHHHLGDYIESYLGGSYFLYRTVLKTVNNNISKRSISSFWHYDLVGRRLKLFFYLNSCTSVSTVISKSTHLSYKPPFYPVSRFLFYLSSFFKHRANIRVFPDPSKILLFDTNTYHKASISSSSNPESRVTVQIDIMLKSKYSLLAHNGHLLGL